jgi:N12 class adenine-specific DNA methylase
MNYRGTGIVAYDVGVGKTMTAIAAISDGMEKGLFKRPMVVVPQKVYKKWIAEISGVKADKDIKKGKKIIHKKRRNNFRWNSSPYSSK